MGPGTQSNAREIDPNASLQNYKSFPLETLLLKVNYDLNQDPTIPSHEDCVFAAD